MQINGLSVTSVYSPKTNTESREQSRLPAVIETTPITVEVSETDLLPAVSEPAFFPDTTTANDQQRSRFIPLLADALPVNPQDASVGDTDPVFRPVAEGVAQYTQIASLTTESPQRLFDEIV